MAIPGMLLSPLGDLLHTSTSIAVISYGVPIYEDWKQVTSKKRNGVYSPSSASSSSSAASPIVPLAARSNVGPNAAPLSVDILATGILSV
jgi:hypothetical protein